MKFSKAALKVRHVQLGHLTALGDMHLPEEASSAPARRYSTEWYDTAPTNNGIEIPPQLKAKIEAAKTPSAIEKEKPSEPEMKQAFSGWGFFR